MKKSTLLKLVLVFVTVFMVANTYGQGTAVPGAPGVVFTTGTAITMVQGTTIPLYAKPDPTYHSAWTYGGPWTLTPGFVWNWSVTVGAAGDFTFTPALPANDNYVTIHAAAAALGAYTISVTEQAPLAYGGCTGAAQNQVVNVVTTPAATLGALAGTSPNYCTGDAGIPAAVPVTISGGQQAYRLVWTLEIATLGAGLAKDEYFSTLKTSLGAAPALAVNYTTGTPEAVAASGAHGIMSVASFTAIDPDGAGPLTAKPTVYTYTLTSINDQALRLGDYITLAGDASNAAAFSYNAIGQTYSVQINPAPITGPIYHIPVTWAN